MVKLILQMFVAGVIVGVCRSLDAGTIVTVIGVLIGIVVVHLAWERFIFKPYAYLGAMPVASDDPIMLRALERAQESLPEFLELYPQHREDSMVKFRFRTDSGATEGLWGDLVELDAVARTGNVYLRTPPLDHAGELDRNQSVAVEDMIDWQIEMRDGSIRGGFTNLALFKIYEREQGQLHPQFLGQVGRFTDRIDPAPEV